MSPRAHALGHAVSGERDAPVLVLGSSLGTTHAMWDDALPGLERHFRVVRYDHLGHGDSPVPPGPYTLDQLTERLLDLLDHLGVRTAHHVGVSLGGAVAMRLAATHPERVDRLGLVCTAARFGPAQVWHDRADSVRDEGLAGVRESSAMRWFAGGFAGSARGRELLDSLAQMSPEGYAACCEALADCDLGDDLAVIGAPTLVIAGDGDVATPPERARELADGISGPARVEVIAGGAHLLAVEHAPVVGDLLVDHLTAGP